MHTYTYTQLTYLLMSVCMFIEKRKGIKAVHKQRREQHEANREAIQIQQSFYACVCMYVWAATLTSTSASCWVWREKTETETEHWKLKLYCCRCVAVALALCGGKNIEHRNSNSAALCWVHSTVGNKTFCKLKHKQSSRAETECRAVAVAASVAVAACRCLSTEYFLPSALLGKLEFCYVKRVVGAATVLLCYSRQWPYMLKHSYKFLHVCLCVLVCECVFFMFRVLGAALQAPVTSWVMLMVVGGNVIAVSLDTFHTIDPPLGHVCLPGCSLTGIENQ